MRFGQGCYTGDDIPPFNPICTYPEIPPSAAATFNVPVPKFAPPTPPNECVCFSFNRGEANVISTCKPNNDYKISVEIAQHDPNDCCSGVYDIRPTIEMPCLPFTFNAAIASVKPLSQAGAGAKVGATLTFEPDCIGCKVTPKLNIIVPDPIAPSVCFRVQGDEPENNPAKFKLTFTAEDEDHPNNPVGDPAEFTVGKTDAEDCNVYQVGSGSFNLMALNGGGVNVTPGNGGATLEIDGGQVDADGKVWYGGGYGDKAADTPDFPWCRGPYMQNGNTSELPNRPVPNITVATGLSFLITPADRSGFITGTKWCSGRQDSVPEGFEQGELDIIMPTGAQWYQGNIALTLSQLHWTPSGVLSTLEETQHAILVAPGAAVTTSAKPNPSVPGVTIPAGTSTSGLTYAETAESTPNDPKYGTKINTGYGMQVYGVNPNGSLDWSMLDTADHASKVGQLSVQYGYGLRIHLGYDPVTLKAKYEEEPSGYVGALEANYGKGMRMLMGYATDTGDPIYEDNPGSVGALEVNYGRGLHITQCSTDAHNNKIELNAEDRDFSYIAATADAVEDAKLVINDASAAGEADLFVPGINDIKWDRWSGNDVVFRILTNVTIVNNVPNSQYVYLRFLKNGVLLGAYSKADGKALSGLELARLLGGGSFPYWSDTERGKKYVKACATT